MEEGYTLIICAYSKYLKNSAGGTIVISGLFLNKAPDLKDSVW